jgi:tRNA 2-thiouridine synthesizing protein A
MSAPWLGRRARPAGRHAAPRGRAADSRDAGQSGFPVAETSLAASEPAPWDAPGPWEWDASASSDAQQTAAAATAAAPGEGFLGAPPMADAVFISQVTDAARAAVADAVVSAVVPPGAEPVVTIDAVGRKCPIPIIMLAARIVEVPVGSVIAVLANDPAAYTDIPAWCGLKSHDCVFRADLRGGGWAFGVRRY